MRVLVIGSGGREHAICWKLKQSTKLKKLYAAPGNPGIAQIAECVSIKSDEISALLNFAKDREIDLTVVGPEIPLGLGIADEFSKAGLKIFGPSKDAARLETSKIFAKEFMLRHNIPSAGYKSFNINTRSEVLQYLKKINYPAVIKADGLAAGKGVVICEDKAMANSTVLEFFDNRIFGSSGENIVVEEYLTGSEASVFAMCDGTDYVVLPPAQDHKKIGDGDTGKNTGGMGSFAPANKIVTGEVLKKVKERIIEPVLKGMREEGYPYSGCLYCGLMIDDKNDPRVIEFNVRFGDPEAQIVLPLITSDFLELLCAAAEGRIERAAPEIQTSFYTCVVLASAGYPDKYETGKEITGLDKITDGCTVFHAGTKSSNGKLLTGGGRVLNVVGRSDSSLKESIDIAYKNAEVINFENKYYRKDIGRKGL